MTTITSLTRDTAATASISRAPAVASATPASGANDTPASTTVSLSDAPQASRQSKAVVWENRTKSTSSFLMTRNFAEPLAGRLKGLGGELLKQVAYDGADFSQSIQQAPTGVQADTYEMLVSPSQVSQHGLGDNRVGLTITTRSGVSVELSLDASDNGIAVEAHSDGKLNEAERKALGKLSEAFQKAVDGLTEDPPRVDLAGLTQFDSAVLSSVDLKGTIKLNPKETQNLEFHADSTKRTLSFSGPDGVAKIGVDLSQPATWGGKQQQAKALDRYLQQVDQAGMRGQGNGAMLTMFKDAPASPTATLALDLDPHSQNYKYTMIDESASSTTSIEYDQGKLVKASLEMQASRSTRVLEYMLGKLKADHTTPSGKAMTRDLLPTLAPAGSQDGTRMDDHKRTQMLAKLNDQIFLQSNPDAIPNEHT